MTDEKGGIFSFGARVRLESERLEATHAAEARAARLAARLASERRLESALEVIARKHCSFLERLKLTGIEALSEAGRNVVAWLLGDDRHASTVSSDHASLVLLQGTVSDPRGPAVPGHEPALDLTSRSSNGTSRHLGLG